MIKHFVGVSAVAVAISIVAVLGLMKEQPTKADQVEEPPNVSVQEVSPIAVDDVILGFGQVNPRWQTVLASEVSGRVLSVSDDLLSGSSFFKGEVLAKVDSTSYEVALANAVSARETAQRVFLEEQQRAQIAEENWKQSGFSGEPSNLLMRKPQLREAEAAIASAQRSVEKAVLDVEQTRILAPYDGVVLERSISPGEILQVGGEIARIYDRSVFDIVVPLNDDEISRLNPDVLGISVVVAHGGQTGRTWHGTVARIEQSVDPTNRWQNIVVEVLNTDGLLPGTFVQVELPGKHYSRTLVLPEHVVGQDGYVWFVGPEDQLQRFRASVLFSRDGLAYIVPPDRLSLPIRTTANYGDYYIGTRVNAVQGQEPELTQSFSSSLDDRQ